VSEMRCAFFFCLKFTLQHHFIFIAKQGYAHLQLETKLNILLSQTIDNFVLNGSIDLICSRAGFLDFVVL
jgi:hypothetical protein